MPWFKVDDSFWSHPKLSDISHEAISLWVRAGAYCAQHLTDGLISPTTIQRQLWTSLDAAEELVAAGLWSRTGDDFQFHDWLEYQPSADSTLKKRDEARERMRKARAAKKGRSQDVRANDSSSSQDVRSTPSPYPNPYPLDDDSQVSLLSNYRARKEIDLEDHTKQALSELGVEATAWAVAAAQLNLRDERGLVEVASWLLGKTIEVKQNPTGYLIGCLRASLDEVQAYVTDMDLVA